MVEYYLPTYFQIVRGYTPGKSGYMMIPLVRTERDFNCAVQLW